MDLRVTCQASAELLSRTAAQTAPEASVQAPAFGAARTDRAELSTGRPARDSEAERLHALAQAQKQAELVRQQAREEAERARETAEAMAKWLDARLKCLKIASRIMSGDRVPPEDSRFLLENDPKLYQMAVTGRLPKEDPKEHKRRGPRGSGVCGRADAKRFRAGGVRPLRHRRAGRCPAGTVKAGDSVPGFLFFCRFNTAQRRRKGSRVRMKR